MIPPGALLDQWIAGRLIASGLDPGNSAQDFRAALEAWQTSCLAATLRHAGEHSLYYRRILPLAASLAEDLESRAAAGRPVAPGGALAALPFTWPQDLAADPEGFLAVSLSETEGVITSPSSGSSGEAKRVYSTAEDLQSSVDFFSQGMRFLAEPGDRVAMLMSGERPGSVGDLFARAMRRAAIDCLVLGPVLDEEETLRRLAAFRPHCLVALPAQALALARHPLAAELSKRKPAILLSADFVSPGLALAVEKGLGGPVFIHYGMTETGLAGAVECPERRGCHSREGDLFLEIVDEYGRTHDPDARSGATRWGEITVTTLTRRAMPLLRYRTGDLGRLITRPCPCGSALYRLEVQGRLSGTIPPRGKPRISLREIDSRLHLLPFVRGFSAVVRYRDADLSLPAALTVELDLTPTAPAEALSLAEASLARLLPGLDLCAVRRPPGLPLRQGKQSIRHVADAADSRTSLPAGQAARTRTGKTPPGGEGPAAGLILAAGYSRRMGGRAKALAQLGGKSLLERSVSALRQGGVSLIVAVIGHDGVKTGREATRLGIRAVTNPDIDEGMFSSVRAGLVHLAPEQCGAVLVLPVDAALVLGRSVSAMLALGQEKLAAASPLVPSFLGRPGHPVLIPASHRPALRRWSGQGGLRGYLAGLALALQRDLQPPLHCPLPDAGIVCDLDTPAQLAEAEAFLAATGDRSHPSLDEAWQELTLAGPAQGGIRHALLVAGGAARLARGLKARGLSPPRESGPAFSRLVPLCLRAGLLHAVTGRRADPAAKDGARLASLGWEETAGLVGRFQSEIALSECPEPDIRLALAAACVRMAAALALEDNPGAWEGFVPDGRRTGADMGLEAWFASALGRPPRDCIRDTPPDEEERRLALLAAGADADQEKL